MEQIILVLIYIHAFFGGIGLISGLISIISRKGNIFHKKSGEIFSISMIISSLLSLFIAIMPNHKNIFLFLIGIFTVYLIITGNRALNLKNKVNNTDKLISGLMLLTSIIMLTLGFIGSLQKIDNSFLYIFFGSIGTFMTYRDSRMFKVVTKEKKLLIKIHLGKMTGAFIASITAFLVAGLNIKTLIVWILPTILGTFYIIFWNRKFKNNSKILIR